MIIFFNIEVEDDVNYSWIGVVEILNFDSNIIVIVLMVIGNYIFIGDCLGCEVFDVQLVEVVFILIDLN